MPHTLPRSVRGRILLFLREVADSERRSRVLRYKCAEIHPEELLDCWAMLSPRGMCSARDVSSFLQAHGSHGMGKRRSECAAFVRQFDWDCDGCLDFSEFVRAVCGETEAVAASQRRVGAAHAISLVCRLLESEVELHASLEAERRALCSILGGRREAATDEAYAFLCGCDDPEEAPDYLPVHQVALAFKHNWMPFAMEDLHALMSRLDVDGDGLVSFADFRTMFEPDRVEEYICSLTSSSRDSSFGGRAPLLLNQPSSSPSLRVSVPSPWSCPAFSGAKSAVSRAKYQRDANLPPSPPRTRLVDVHTPSRSRFSGAYETAISPRWKPRSQPRSQPGSPDIRRRSQLKAWAERYSYACREQGSPHAARLGSPLTPRPLQIQRQASYSSTVQDFLLEDHATSHRSQPQSQSASQLQSQAQSPQQSQLLSQPQSQLQSRPQSQLQSRPASPTFSTSRSVGWAPFSVISDSSGPPHHLGGPAAGAGRVEGSPRRGGATSPGEMRSRRDVDDICATAPSSGQDARWATPATRSHRDRSRNESPPVSKTFRDLTRPSCLQRAT
mmetsp:Transcript_43055/g.89948  ORF Transcript_43055/g.89948 Transcript_43055/m.89948 type:complete len:558 (+) Transcript_43055:188-1861(+)